jgi:hypothetical protein
MKLVRFFTCCVAMIFISGCLPNKLEVGSSEVAEDFDSSIDSLLIAYNAAGHGVVWEEDIDMDNVKELTTPFINHGIDTNIIYINNIDQNGIDTINEVLEGYEYYLIVTPLEIYNGGMTYGLFLHSNKDEKRIWVSTINVGVGWVGNFYDRNTEMGQAIYKGMKDDKIL